MAQERIDDFMSMAKHYAKAEKELGVQHWVCIGIERLDANGNRMRLFAYDLPRELYERRRWVVRWRVARLQCMYPRDVLCTYFSYYDKRLGNDAGLTEDLHKLVSAKAQVSRMQGKIAEYVAWHKANDMFFDENTDQYLIAAREKLVDRQAKVQAVEERMKNKIEQISKIK